MAGHPTVLTHTMTAQFPCGQRVAVIARYDPRDPLALRFHFGGTETGPEWLFARDLLIEALWLGSAGDGDVRFRTDKSNVDSLWLALDSPDGHAELRFAVDDLTELATAIHQRAPMEGCPVDWDTELRTLAEWGR